jgi:hypothetical protein
MQKNRNDFLAFRAALIVLISLMTVSGSGAQSIMEHLDFLAHKITSEQPVPKTLEEIKSNREDLRKKVLKIIGLDPMPEKTPLNARLVGEKVDLGNCYFQRVVFESRPKVYVAAHLYIPKNVEFPVPAIIQVPGHSRRDHYRPHPRTYAENGFVAIGMPMVGEEGKIGSGWGKCGEWGAYVGHFNWYNTGYTTITPTVWDGIRAVDYLLTLTDENGVKMVDEKKIGMSGLSGGSARTLWTTIADPRISCAVVNEGFTAVEKYDTKNGISNTCDIHLFYNYFGLSYGEIYSLIAPRPLLVQHGAKDVLYPNPLPVAGYLSEIYALYGASDKFDFRVWDQGHGYTSNIWNIENEWMDRWLRNGDKPLKIYGEFDAELTCFPNGLPEDMANQEKVYTPKTPEWKINSEKEYADFKDFLLTKMKEEMIHQALANHDAELKTVSSKNENGYWVDSKILRIDGGSIEHAGYYFSNPNEKQDLVILISKDTIDLTNIEKMYEDSFLKKKVNLFCLEITGTGHNPWSYGDYNSYDRFAQIIGYTHASLQIQDILGAVRTIKADTNANIGKVYLWADGELTVPVMYAAAVSDEAAGVILQDAQDRHIGITPEKETHCSTAIFNSLRYADIPQIAGLIYPRKIVLIGDIKEGFEWTEKLYKKLGSKTDFIKMDGAEDINKVLEKL